MSFPAQLSRFAAYYGRHGFWATLRRAGVAMKRSVFSNRMVLFYCELSGGGWHSKEFAEPLEVEPKRGSFELSSQDRQEIMNAWNPNLAYRNMTERFDKGAVLWLARLGGRLAGYGWTLQGHTIERHYFPLGAHDVHLFDFYVFPQYRGRGVNPLLVTNILRNLAHCGGRAFIEAAEWNRPQLSSLKKTPFRRLGAARKLTIFGRTLVCWDRGDAARNAEEEARGEALAGAPGRSGPQVAR